ncbi:LysR family transcriptional regulator substrate-binding protein [Paenibacillus eucommiae]|uniref:DNA-binding transcriptional LysR family regulator n=1 Tax=Paenibacillus eucommiae TaxID=1355755 RepID=A0ABS4IWI1_9BACL|nr:DNA-binding transcriptional LysR family regulator [Paenibacillus eucommiae]
MSFIVFPKTHKCRQQIEIAFQLLGISLKPIIETDAPESIISLIEARAGVSILSKTLINIWNNDNIKIIKIENPSIRRQIGLIYYKRKNIWDLLRGEFINIKKNGHRNP